MLVPNQLPVYCIKNRFIRIKLKRNEYIYSTKLGT